MRALLLVDLQYDFLPGGALAVANGDETIAVARRLMPRFETIVATQDWHPSNHASFAVNHPGTQPGQKIDLDGLPQVLWPPHCVAGTRGAELHDDIDQRRLAAVIRKGEDPRIDSYSGFFDNARRKETQLHNWLQEHRIQQLYVMGLATDYCVKATVIDAIEHGYEVWVIENGCRGVNLAPGDHDKAINIMRGHGATIIESGNI